ncbi:MAG TPA: hypothetical protein DCE41_33805 [Cytophagales bacterium]|nr:hypothetical protein [Cytophagales bacterium]HAA24274.1 hypothetical protein [Cytophagales bacterium]HAP59402.1 hypothetical protein [Cytophagales bacterium]
MKTTFKVLGCLFIIGQLIFIAYSQRYGNRYACWAPHDIWTHYEIVAYSNGTMISDSQTARFFGRKKGRKDLPPDHLEDWITFGLANHTTGCDSVVFHYSVNLREWKSTTLFPN